MSFKRKSRDRPLESNSDTDNWVPKKEGEMSFELFCKYFGKKFDEHDNKMESKLHYDAKLREK